MKDRAHDDAMAEVFRKGPGYAAALLNSTHLYRALSAKGNPEIRSLSAILKTMALRLAVPPVH